jgi:hypothetical protein
MKSKIKVSYYNDTMSYTFPNSEATCEEYLDVFVGMLELMTFHKDTIQDVVIDLAKHYQKERNENEKLF